VTRCPCLKYSTEFSAFEYLEVSRCSSAALK
jgi:hypothetical protein